MTIFNPNNYFNIMQKDLLEKYYELVKNKGAEELISALKQEFGHNNLKVICDMIPFELLHENQDYEILTELKHYERMAKRS